MNPPTRPFSKAETGKNVVPEEIPTVIIDGFWGWHPRWKSLQRAIDSRGGPCEIWEYDSSGRTSLEVLGAELATVFRQLDGPFNAVGYSMGGLIVREAMRQDPSLPLQRVALLNSPHQGSLVANFLPLAACREMRPGSAFLRRLNASPWPHPTFATWCPTDLVVVPGWSARWPEATEIQRLDMPAHAWPIVSARLHHQVALFLVTD